MSNNDVSRGASQSDNGHQPSLGDPSSSEPTPTVPLTSITADGHQEKGGESASVHRDWRCSLRDGLYRRKLTKTLWLCLSFVAVGVGAGQRGPAFLDLQLITNTNVQQASAFFTAGSVGYVVGAMLGGVVYDLYSKSLSIIISLTGMAAFTVATPFCRKYALMVAVSLLGAVFGGVLETTVNADLIRLWGGEGGAAMQSIHFAFAFGGVIAPLITEPFLAPRVGHVNTTLIPFTEPPYFHGHDVNLGHLNGTEDHLENLKFLVPDAPGGIVNVSALPGKVPSVSDQSENNLQASASTRLPDWTAVVNASGPQIVLVEHKARKLQPQGHDLNQSGYNTSLEKSDLSGDFNTTREVSEASPDTRVHYAFLINGLIGFLAAILLLHEYIRDDRSCKKRWRKRRQRKAKNNPTHGEKEDKDGGKNKKDGGQKKGGRVEMPRPVFVLVLVWICGFFMLYVSTEDTFMIYLTTFAVLQLDWSKSQGAMLTSVFWACFAASRFISIGLSRLLTPVQLLASCCVFMVISYAGFLVASLLTLPWAIWTFTALIGASMSAIYPAGLSWMEEELVAVTGRTASCISLATTMVLTVNQQVLGHLMQNNGAIWLSYILLGEALACAMSFFLLLLFSRTLLKSRYGTRRHHDYTITVGEDDGHQADMLLKTKV